jgi:hypothetical protein
VLASHEDSLQIHRDQAVEDGHVQRDDVCISHRCGGVGSVVVQYIEASKRLNRRLDHPDNARLVRNVDLNCDSTRKLIRDTLRGSQVDVRKDD